MTIEQIPSAPFDENAQTLVRTDENYAVDKGIDIIDVVAAALTITLPASPLHGQRHRVLTPGGAATVNGNGNNIVGPGNAPAATFPMTAGQAVDFTFSTNNVWLTSCCEGAAELGPSARITRNPQSTPPQTFDSGEASTPVLFDSVVYDTSGGGMTGTPNRLTAPVSGTYAITAQVTITPFILEPPSPIVGVAFDIVGVVGSVIGVIARKSEEQDTGFGGALSSVSTIVTTQMRLSAGDQIEVQLAFYIASGNENSTVDQNSYSPTFEMTRVDD